MAFGKKLASDSRDSGGEYIRRFKDEETQIRLAPATSVNRRGEEVYGTAAWPQEFEHFDNSESLAYPCLGKDSDCVGCADPNEKVSKVTKRIYVEALDEEGEPRLFKMGSKLHKRLKLKEQRMLAKEPSNLQPLSDVDVVVVKSGKGLETEYDAEIGERYEIDGEWADFDFPSLDEALQAEYIEACEVYGEDPPEFEAEPEEEKPKRGRRGAAAAEDEAPARGRRRGAAKAEAEDEEEAKPARRRAAKKAEPEEEAEPEAKPSRRGRAAKKATAPEPEPEADEQDEPEEEKPAPRKRATASKRASKRAEPEPEADEDGDEALPEEPTEDQIREASTDALKVWLTDGGTEFPPRAARKRLVEIALEEMDYPPY